MNRSSEFIIFGYIYIYMAQCSACLLVCVWCILALCWFKYTFASTHLHYQKWNCWPNSLWPQMNISQSFSKPFPVFSTNSNSVCHYSSLPNTFQTLFQYSPAFTEPFFTVPQHQLILSFIIAYAFMLTLHKQIHKIKPFY